MSLALRDYQTDLVESVRTELRAGLRRLCIVSPTRSGKTQVFSYMAGRATGRVWIVVHRRELANQTSKTLAAWGVPHGIISPGRKYDGQRVQVCFVDTLSGRIKSGADPIHAPDVLIVDECDLAEAATWQRVIQKYSEAILLGFTATPQRLDGKGLGNTYQKLVMGPSVPFLMDAGHLARPVYYGVPSVPDLSGLSKERGDFNRAELAAAVEDSPVLTGDIVEHYHRIAPGTRYVGFAVSIRHAERLAEDFTRAGYPSAAISSKSNDRDELTARLRSGSLTGLWTVDIFGRGVDVPAIETGILARPTMSLALHLQQVGRVLRPAEGKTARIIDHAGNLQRHGSAEFQRQWSLDCVPKGHREAEALMALTQCGSCHAHFKTAAVCPYCGATCRTVERKVKEIDGWLTIVSQKEIDAEIKAKQDAEKKEEKEKKDALERAREAKAKAERMAQGACKTEGELVALFIKQGSKKRMALIRAKYVLNGRKAATEEEQRRKQMLAEKRLRNPNQLTERSDWIQEPFEYCSMEYSLRRVTLYRTEEIDGNWWRMIKTNIVGTRFDCYFQAETLEVATVKAFKSLEENKYQNLFS